MTRWQHLAVWIKRQRIQLEFTLRVTVAAVLALAVAQWLQLRLPLWAVLTAVIVTQISVGRSLKATVDYLAGTLGGAVYGGAVAMLLAPSDAWSLLASLAIAIAPMSLLASLKPRLAAAPITAIIVLLVPAITHATALASAVDRVFEVAVGAFTGIVVSFLLVPARAHAQVADLAARILDDMGRALRALLARSPQALDVDALHRIQDGIGQSLGQLSVSSAEAEHELAAHIATAPNTGPLTRTLLRLRHDLVMIGRAIQQPPPEPIKIRLELPSSQVCAEIAGYLSAAGSALRERRGPPSRAAADAALDAFGHELEALRADGLTRPLTADEAERFFAFGFALEQLRQNLRDLERCVGEWASDPSGKGGQASEPDTAGPRFERRS